MAETIPIALRQQVFDRAEGRCEYRLLSQLVAAHKHEPDHIIPLQHDGQTSADNLVLAWTRCNRYKGYNVGSFDPETGELIAFSIRANIYGQITLDWMVYLFSRSLLKGV